ncbi:class I SAM-dependent methyltransferase [Spongiactinospora sp. 9N601]|uniref:class I SAM-dependent methyltransferase n=1 Tax=Spongiactinospora sp. 9N601 TaxID=3375149 RepID=UPI003787FB82
MIDRAALPAGSWDEAAEGYERYFVPRFAPWGATAVSALRGASLPPGPILVPCCGTFPELPVLAADHPGREIVGIDLSAEMAGRARRGQATDAPDLTARRPGAAAAVVSVFGLQRLPDPVAALAGYCR